MEPAVVPIVFAKLPRVIATPFRPPLKSVGTELFVINVTLQNMKNRGKLKFKQYFSLYVPIHDMTFHYFFDGETG